MSTKLIGLLVTGVLLLLISPASGGYAFELSQVDYYNSGVATDADSDWGQIDLVYTTPTQLEFLNIVANPGTPGETWLVQNHPLLPTSYTATTEFTSTSFFDLGAGFGSVGIGDVTGSSLAFESWTDVAPWDNTAPMPFTTQSGSSAIGRSQDIVNSGVPSGVTTLNAPVSSGINWNVPFLGIDIRFNKDMPNVVQEKNFCGPGSATNSLHWLANNSSNITIADTLGQTQTTLAGLMGNTNIGNWDDTMVEGKLKYIKDNNLPIEVHYAGGKKLPTNGDYTSPNGNGKAKRNGNLTWAWLKAEMDKGQDIELMTGSHWVVLSGYITWDGIHLIQYRDDPYQHGAATTNAEKAVIAKRYSWTYFFEEANGDVFVNIGSGREKLLTAVAESEIPEPATFFVMTCGMIGLLRRRRRA